MTIWQIQDAIEQSGIKDWGASYFSIDKKGRVIATPLGTADKSIPLPEVIEKAKKSGICTPMIIRFPQIIKSQMQRMHEAFSNARREFSYPASYMGVFPFKVNQRREFIDAIVGCGKELNWGLEVGSKTEFMAALSYEMSDQALLICNGFKDEDFISMAFDGKAMGKNVVLVIEGPDELQLINDQMRRSLGSAPEVGLRVRLYSKGAGKWENSSGESSKFGLTTIELMHVLKLLKESNQEKQLTMLHFHIGSQITAIRRFKNALKEAALVYAKIYKMGFRPTHLNIGGGVGVDYDGSRTSAQSSANYSLQEFANDAIYVIGEVCAHEKVPCPNIVTESGRVIAAYHSVVATDIREVQGGQESLHTSVTQFIEEAPNSVDADRNIKELTYIYENMSSKNYVEYYHDAIEYHENLFTLFNLGYLNLSSRAVSEDLFNKICMRALYFSTFQKHPPVEFSALQKLKVSKYLANFSIFQSIPDAWSIDQLFPILPLSRQNERPSHKGTIVDITCDSDGCIDRFVDRQNVKSELDLHRPDGQPYYLGFFLVGAYQESLANEHNLFGAINEVEVITKEDGSWEILKTTEGDDVQELLISRNYDRDEMIANYDFQLNRAMESGQIEGEEQKATRERLLNRLESYPYLLEKRATTK